MLACGDPSVTSFDSVADAYDRARPEYPHGVFDALEPLAGRRVLEGGAGTGIATRALLRRGASVVPFDVGVEMLRRATSHTFASGAGRCRRSLAAVPRRLR